MRRSCKAENAGSIPVTSSAWGACRGIIYGMQVATFGRWYPESCDRGQAPTVGCVVAYEFKPWRVIDMRLSVPHPEHPDELFTVYQLRPADADAVDDADRDIHRGWRGTPSGYAGPVVLREHYGLCVHCDELLPCREVMAERWAQENAKRMSRYETPGMCPACLQPVTTRQKSETLPNVVVPLGPPVTFHAGRKGCAHSLRKYREKVDSMNQFRVEDC